MTTSLSDIAERAGVSIKTVSGALHGGSARMSEQTRLRIKEIAEELGYVTNLAARGMRQGWMPLIGVVADDLITSPSPPRSSADWMVPPARRTWRSLQ